LSELDVALSGWLQTLLLEKLRSESPSSKKWGELIDVKISFPGGEEENLKDVAARELIDPAKSAKADEKRLRKRPMTSRRSALLFGPPGTSKTSFAKALAGVLRWPVIVVTPSDFLNEGLEKIYVRVNEVFEDLEDISGAVILFDEMDALAQTRGN